ncbi:MAG: TspO and MBR like protein [Berkelbacteria bacterium GW2011_GWA1_36_9]|uniref:TspO and MBR like protein n=1 Tax=Berkelbacteria bacterium GW2011_GWA1_36_9 TaxID=1618331 RepID=A0A0G0I182_9BACT|nr:MAG: TspO and MBR like protein [Berkelbacteria bacterium GW2011_GWA1_36_9]
MNTYNQYLDYKKPPLSPPAYLFGIVWPILYALIIISYGFIFYKAFKNEISWKLTIPFIINLIANVTYTYIQFRLKNYTLATIDILIVLATIIITMILTWSRYRWVFYMQIPYLIWVTFATYLQIAVTILNR